MTKICCVVFLILNFALGATFDVADAASKPDFVVAADGSGDFKNVQEAINAVPDNNEQRAVIFIKAGVYKGHFVVPKSKIRLTVRGEDAEKTRLTNDLHMKSLGADGREVGTIGCATFVVQAPDFMADNLTFENNAPHIAQALAIYADADRVQFRKCRFLGYQDTIRVRSGRQYFEDCFIEGRTDFIYGEATAWFERCHIHVLDWGWITAANTPQEQAFGLVFSHCKITGEAGVKTLLGRPWRNFASTIWLHTEIHDTIAPEGWNNWNKPEAEKTVRYAEWNSQTPDGKIIDLAPRVSWAKKLTIEEAAQITTRRVLSGEDGWNPTR